MTIIEINEMIDLISRFMRDSACKNLVIGGLVGSHPLSYALDVVTETIDFEDILILEGCADFCYINKPFVKNYIPYYYALKNVYGGSLCDDDIPFSRTLFQNRIYTKKVVNEDFINKFEFVIINNAHLIDLVYLDEIVKLSKWKCITIVDPFDIYGEHFLYATTIVDTLEKQSPIIGFARKLYGYNTYIDKNVPGDIKAGKITRRGVGKIDGRMHVCDDSDIVNEANQLQIKRPFKRGQRLFVTDNRLEEVTDDSKETHIITNTSMIVVERAISVNSIPNYLRIYHSRNIFRGFVKYYDPYSIGSDVYDITVKPANVLHINDSIYHRYMNTVVSQSKGLTKRELYSITKNSVNMILCDVKGG